jgi:hypothetical protein
MAKGTTFTIFYAWQSDTDEEHNRYLIRDALKEARKRLNADKTIPYQVDVDSDTEGAPGMCDIPAEVLRKLEAADAAILDLTFVAATDATPPKRCSNPNVLFELGYAFHAIEPKRLICVMNSKYGEPWETLFDVNHRRWPIAYTSPRDGFSGKQIVSSLADQLVGALKPIIALGPRRADESPNRSEELFAKESEEIRTHWESTFKEVPAGPTLFFTLQPTNYERRWEKVKDLEKAHRESEVVNLERQNEYPPSRVDTNVMSWGLFNSTYREPDWALTYSGQFWAAVNLSSSNAYDLNERDQSIHKFNSQAPKQLAPNTWINYPYGPLLIANVFNFAGSWAKVFGPEELLTWSARVDGLRGTFCASSSRRFMHCSRPCASPSAAAGGTLPAGEFRSKWQDCCLDIMEETFSMYDLGGNRIDRETLSKFLDKAIVGDVR